MMATRKKSVNKVKVTLVKSTIHRLANQKATVKALGIRKMHQTVEHYDTRALRGMINTVSHLVTVEKA